MPRRFRFVALLALLVASVAILGACGGGDESSDSNAGELLKATFGSDQNVESGNLAVTLGLNAKGLQGIDGPISLKLNGPFQTVGKGKLPELDLALTLSGAGANFSAGAVTLGDKGWLKLQGTTYLVDDATFEQFKKGYEEAASKTGDGEGGTSFSSLGIDPLRWLQDPVIAGTETVGGAETRHITAGVDVGAFLDDVSTLLGKAGQLGDAAANVPSSLTAQQKKDIEASVKDASLEVWTGSEDKALRRIKLVIGIDVPEAVRSRAGGLSTGTLNFDLTITDLNEAQEISEPEDARPLSELQQLIAGGATGATQAPATTTTTPSDASSGAAPSKYLDCIAAAGSDIAKVQQCATLVGQ